MTADTPSAASDDDVMRAVLGRIVVPDRVDPGPSLWDFGAVGVHGGLAPALLVRAIRQRAGTPSLASNVLAQQ